MKEWSNRWIASTQPRKQRKYRHNAPLHVRQRFLSANLSPELRKRYGKRSMQIRKGDEVTVMRGGLKKRTGTVEKVDISKCRVYVDEIKVKKVDGSEVQRPIQPSNLMITKLKLDDKKRQAILDRAEQAKKPVKARPKPAPEKEKPSKEETKKTPEKKPPARTPPKKETPKGKKPEPVKKEGK